jgi:hypothetical protein
MLALIYALACSGGEPKDTAETNTDTDTDAETETDTDTDTDADTDTQPTSRELRIHVTGTFGGAPLAFDCAASHAGEYAQTNDLGGHVSGFLQCDDDTGATRFTVNFQDPEIRAYTAADAATGNTVAAWFTGGTVTLDYSNTTTYALAFTTANVEQDGSAFVAGTFQLAANGDTLDGEFSGYAACSLGCP